jgi:DNA-binding NarL/FixJ family response regulator
VAARQEADPVPIRVFVCDDAPDHRALVRAVLADQPDLEVVGEASDGATCLTGMALTRPDVLVLDLQMPVKDGWDVLAELRGRPAGPRVLVVSSEARARDRVREAGAEFLVKGAPVETLRAAIRLLGSS